ncbi:MAG: DNA replication and repair protein RecF [Magnetococcales bacterium]|nr:DNA replication and repair protein RecF [Magnetococcales bacterium]
MQLERLRIRDFRNISQADLRWSDGLNLLLGDNGQGKSNLLEAIGLLASGRSFRRAPASLLRRHGQEGFHLHGEVISGGLTHHLEFASRSGQQMVRLNGKGVTTTSAMGQVLAAVVLTPDAPALIRGAPEARRDHLDWMLFCQRRGYAGLVRDYQSALRARNQLLRSQCRNGGEFDAWESRLAHLGGEMTRQRQQMLQQVEVALAPFLEAMALDPQGYRWHMRCQVEPDDYATALVRSRPADQRSGCTSVGPHRDDPLFLYHGRALARFASRGQQKRFLLALKLAEARLLQERLGEAPLLLLDDPGTELDQEGAQCLMRVLAAGENQLFVATCAAAALPGFARRPVQRLQVVEGVFQSQESCATTGSG